MRGFVTSISFLISYSIFAQNYVYNGGFELYSKCPSSFSEIELANGWGKPINHEGTSDFFHTCSKSMVPTNVVFSQYPHLGEGFGGFLNYSSGSNHREYITSELLIPLDSGQIYTIDVWAVCADSVGYGSDFNIAFTDTLVTLQTTSSKLIGVPPIWTSPIVKDTEKWAQYSFTYEANGKERYILIGNLRNDSQTNTEQLLGNGGTWSTTSYILIDDISIVNCQSVVANPLGHDTTACKGDSVTISTDQLIGFDWQWSEGTTDSIKTIMADTVLIVQYADPCGVYFDTIRFNFRDSLHTNVSQDTTLCQGDSLVVILDSSLTSKWGDDLVKDRRVFYETNEITLFQSNGCFNRTDSFSITFIDYPTLHLGNDTTICQDDSLGLNPQTTGDFKWEDGSDELPRHWTSPSKITAIVKNSCFELRDSLVLSISQPPDVQLPRDTVICVGEQLFLWTKDSTEGLWNMHYKSANYMVLDSQTVVLQMENMCGVDSDTMIVTSRDCSCIPFIPNAFSPDQNQINESFGMIGHNDCVFENYQIQIYSRWGEKLFESTVIDDKWDGTYKDKACQEGVYLWSIVYLDKYGQNQMLNGIVHLLR